MIYRRPTDIHVLSPLSARAKSDKSGSSDANAHGNSNGPGNGNGNGHGNSNGNGPGNGNGNGSNNGSGNGPGNSGQPSPTQTGGNANPSPSTPPATPSPSSNNNGSGGSGNNGGGPNSGNSGGNTSSSSGPTGNGPSSVSPPSVTPTTDTGGNGSSPPHSNNSGSGSSSSIGADDTSSKGGPQSDSGLPTDGPSLNSPGSPMSSPKTDKFSDSSPSQYTTFSSYTYTSIVTSVTTITSGGQAYTSSSIFTSIGLTTIPVVVSTGVPDDSGATTHQPSIGTIVGSVIGSLLGLFLLLLLIFLYRRRRRYGSDISFSIVSPLMAETSDEQESRPTASSIQINMSHVTETDYSKYGAPSTPLASLFNMARSRSSQPFFRPMSQNFYDRRGSSQNPSPLENPFRDHPTPPPITITNPFADPDPDVGNSSRSGETSSLGTFTDVSSMVLTSDDSGAAVEGVPNSSPALREAILTEAPAARSSEAIIEQLARRLSQVPESDISNTAHARKSSELFPSIVITASDPSRSNSTPTAQPVQGSSWVSELYGTYSSEQSRRSSRTDNRHSKALSNHSIRDFAS